MQQKPFKLSGEYYDALYKSKNYKKEVEYILNRIKKLYQNKKINILDLGCGTGQHLKILSQKGHTITGVDISNEMLKSIKKNKKITLIKSNIINFKTNKKNKFDMVICMFHVINYLKNQNQLKKLFEVVNFNLKKHGEFIFETYDTKGVNHHLPEIRMKKIYNKKFELVRLALPIRYFNLSKTVINYKFFYKNKNSHTWRNFSETHSMRDFSKKEILSLSKKFNFTNIRTTSDSNKKIPWAIKYILKKNDI